MDRYGWFSLIVFLVVVLALMLLSAPGQAEGQCCFTPEPEPPIPTLGPAPCNSDTPWGCYEHRLYLPAIVQGSAPTSTPEPQIVTPTPTSTATPTATVTPVPPVTATLVIVTVTP